MTVPGGETPFSYLAELCHEGARRRYHPMTPAVVRQLAHELEVIERTGLAEFFLICWDLMRFAKSRGFPAQGRGSAADSIVAYVLGITRVDPIRDNLLFERFINEGRTTYPDIDIDFTPSDGRRSSSTSTSATGRSTPPWSAPSSPSRPGPRSATSGVALGFPRPLLDRAAKTLETINSAMVRRDLEADGGFAEFFRRPDAGDGREPRQTSWRRIPPARPRSRRAASRRVSPRPSPERAGMTDRMGQLNHARGGRIRTGGAGERGDGRLPAGGGRAPDGRVVGAWVGGRAGSPARRAAAPRHTSSPDVTTVSLTLGHTQPHSSTQRGWCPIRVTRRAPSPCTVPARQIRASDMTCRLQVPLRQLLATLL